ncbi:MAG: helix-turn-helix domain-containing protein [Blastocatellia bacterium]|nr:helix-turn-helix domain-containing protein [Blastocatellia bacterium]
MTLEDLYKLPKQIADLRAELDALKEDLGKKSQAPDALLTAEQAGEFLGLTVGAVRQAAYRGSLPCVKVGRRLRFKPSDLAAFSNPR